MEENKPVEVEAPSMMGGLKNLGFCVLLIGIAWYFYTTMTKYEAGEEISVNRILFIVYKIAGKNITTCIIGVIAAIFGILGIKELVNSRK